jgi:hypothetical protein
MMAWRCRSNASLRECELAFEPQAHQFLGSDVGFESPYADILGCEGGTFVIVCHGRILALGRLFAFRGALRGGQRSHEVPQFADLFVVPAQVCLVLLKAHL